VGTCEKRKTTFFHFNSAHSILGKGKDAISGWKLTSALQTAYREPAMISFFSNLFRKANNNASPSKISTEQASNRVNSTSNSLEDDIPDVYGPELLEIALNDRSAKRRIAARHRLGKLLEQKTINLAQLNSDAKNNDDLLILCSYDAATATELLSTYHEQTTLAALAHEAPTPQVRKAAAQLVTERQAVEMMLKGAKGKDNTIYKIAKTKLAVFKAEDDHLAQQHAHLENLCSDAERHAKKVFDHLYSHKFIVLEQAWQAREEYATDALQQRFDKAISKCQATIDAEIEKSKAAALHEQQNTLIVPEIQVASQAVSDIAEQLYSAETVDDQQISQLSNQLSAQTNRIHRLVDPVDHVNQLDDQQQKTQQLALQHVYQSIEATEALISQIRRDGTLRSLVNTLVEQGDEVAAETRSAILKQLALVKSFPTLSSDNIELANQVIREWQNQQQKQTTDKKLLINSVNDLIKRATIAANSGQIRRARGIAKELHEKRQRLDDIPPGMASKLEQLDETIDKLGDWHDFAVRPKKEALVEKMAALQSSPLDPEDLADKIHELQEEWKLLSKGGQHQDEELWLAFQKNADLAFEPCKEFFSAQTEMREKNALERRQLIAHLNTYHDAYDWENANWKDVENTLSAAKEAWKSLWPVPRQQQKELQASYDAALDLIYARINVTYEIARQKKEHLVSLAEKALQHTDINLAAQEIKQLQVKWKNTGRTHRKTDQQLWNQFRALCDQVFEKRQAQFNEISAEKEQRHTQAKETIAKLVALNELGGEVLQASAAEINELKSTFTELGEIAKAEELRFQKVLANIDQEITQYRTLAKRQTWDRLFELNRQISLLEQQNITEETLNEDDLQSIQSNLASNKLPSGCADILQNRLVKLHSESSKADVGASEKALRLLCIRAEIAKGVNSPVSDKALRMAYQVETLQQNFGKAVVDLAEDLAREWIAVAGCPADRLDPLQERFLECTFKSQNRQIELA
jgi:hypothetical protein